MTEAEWLESTDPIAMLAHVRPGPDDRKSLLFTCACAARQRRRLRDRPLRENLGVWCSMAEQVAEGERPADDLEPLGGELVEAIGLGGIGAFGLIFEVVWLDPEYSPDWTDWMTAADRREQAAQAALVREVFGNPFRRVRARRAWRTPEVMSAAAAAYRRPLARRMSDLGRALARAGCTDERVIEHCRSRGPHVRGCWVVDLILGKS